MAHSSLLAALDEFAGFRGDTSVVQTRGFRRETWTYGKLYLALARVARLLAARGIGRGDRVLLWGAGSAEWMAVFWGILARGAVVVPLDAGSTLDFIERVRRETGAQLAFTDRARASQLSCEVASLEEIGSAFEPVSEADARAAFDTTLGRNCVAEILFTSGTTAEPRGVVLTHGNFLANLEPVEEGIRPYRRWEKWFHPLRFVTLVPLSHVFGQFMGLLVPPVLGAAVVFEASNNPSEIIRTIKRERATALIAVPRMLDALRNTLLREWEALGQREWFSRAFAAADGKPFLRRAWHFRRMHRRFGWKFWAFISGGAALAPETEEFFRRMGYAVVQGYGMTETASLISLNHPFRAAQGSVGRILPGREFRLGDDGEILVRGGSVASAYWEHGAPRRAPVEEDGWLRTGDLGELDAEGNLRFRGRKKNVIVTPAGVNIYPEDLEAALRKQRGVRDGVVVPLESGGNAEPCAVILLDAPAGKTAEAAQAALDSTNASLAEYQRIREWVIWPEPDFPRTPTGKPRLHLITARAKELRSKAAAVPARAGELEDLLLAFAPGQNRAQLERELRLSSLDRVELMSALEERYQVELDETSFAEANTISDVEKLLSERLGANREPAARSAEGGSSRAGFDYPRWPQREALRWLRLAIYYALVWPATQILAHPKIAGREHLRGLRGPALIVCNHVTRRADIGLVLAALPARFRHRLATAMNGETLRSMRHPPREWFFLRRWAYQMGYWLLTALFSVFPLPRLSGFRESFRFAGASVDRGYSVLVFPEGEVTRDGRMAPFQSGIGLLAENLRVPVVPMRMDGVWKMKRQGRLFAQFGEVIVRIGAPIPFARGTPPDQIARELESRVKAL